VVASVELVQTELEVPLMTIFEALTVALILVLATATIIAIYLGLMNWINAVHVVRCATCHHLTVGAVNELQQSCPHCRHPVLMHPLYAAHHPRQASQLRVVGDRLHY
jgi:DNA-directed RNA polymerase subunit RPC12/RpoP